MTVIHVIFLQYEEEEEEEYLEEEAEETIAEPKKEPEPPKSAHPHPPPSNVPPLRRKSSANYRAYAVEPHDKVSFHALQSLCVLKHESSTVYLLSLQDLDIRCRILVLVSLRFLSSMSLVILEIHWKACRMCVSTTVTFNRFHFTTHWQGTPSVLDN